MISKKLNNLIKDLIEHPRSTSIDNLIGYSKQLEMKLNESIKLLKRNDEWARIDTESFLNNLDNFEETYNKNEIGTSSKTTKIIFREDNKYHLELSKDKKELLIVTSNFYEWVIGKIIEDNRIILSLGREQKID